MTDTITTANVIQWDTAMRLLAQQQDSRLAKVLIDRGTITGESFTVNRLAAAANTPANTTRHGDTTWSDITHSARVALMSDYFDALPIDRADVAKILVNPTSRYQQSLLAGWNRRKDRLIYDALRGSAQAKDGSTTALPSGQKIAHGSTGYTKAKVINARKLFRVNENDQHNGKKLYHLYNAQMLEDILADTQLTSADYMTVKMLQEGDVGKMWCGFEWIPYEDMYYASSTYYALAFTNDALEHGMGYFESKLSVRNDKKDTTQASLAASFGSVRAEDTGVVEIAFQ